MKHAVFAVALMMSGTASAQTEMETQTTEPAPVATTSTTTTTAMPASGSVVQPGNENPEHDARNIKVISDPAVVPAGFNGTSSAGTGGPLVDPATNESVADDNYPACSAAVTDNCLQTYERRRKR